MYFLTTDINIFFILTILTYDRKIHCILFWKTFSTNYAPSKRAKKFPQIFLERRSRNDVKSTEMTQHVIPTSKRYLRRAGKFRENNHKIRRSLLGRFSAEKRYLTSGKTT